MEEDQDYFEDYNLNMFFADLETPVLDDFLPPLKVEDQGGFDSDMSFDLSLVHDDVLPSSIQLEEPSNVARHNFQENAVQPDYLQRLKDFCQKEQEREESVVRKQFLEPDQLKDESQPAAELQEISDEDQRVQLFDLLLRFNKSIEEDQNCFEVNNLNMLFADLETPVLDDFFLPLEVENQGGFDSDMSFDLSLVHDDVLPSTIELEEPSNVAGQDFQENAVAPDYLQRLKDFGQGEQEREESAVRKQFLQPDQLKDESQPAAELQEISDDDLNNVFPKSMKGDFIHDKGMEDQPSVLINSIGLEPLHQDLHDQADYSHHQVQADTTYIPQFGNPDQNNHD